MTQITEDYVSCETAKLLKGKGFTLPVKKSYSKNWNSFALAVSMPSQSLVMKWLREVHKLCITITPKVTDSEGSGGCLWEWTITYLLVPQSVSLELFESYEEACEAAIKYCLEKLI